MDDDRPLDDDLVDDEFDAELDVGPGALDELEDDADDGPRPPARRPRGTYLGAAMLGLQQAMFGKVKEDTVIEIEASGDPPNLDLDGLDTAFGPDHRLVGPPLDQIKARAHRRRRRR